MGFFKNVGNKLKRVVSIKNLISGVTGDFSSIGKDVKRVLTSTDPKKGVSVVDTSVVAKGFVLPKPLEDVLSAKDATYARNLESSVASIPLVQKANSFFTKVYLKSQWELYKKWIIGFLVVLISFLLLRKFVFKKSANGRKRR
jgi:hypothetical protein